MGVCQALTLYFGNAAYLHLTVSFVQMLKAFTPVVVLAIGIVFGIEKAETKVCLRSMKVIVNQGYIPIHPTSHTTTHTHT